MPHFVIFKVFITRPPFRTHSPFSHTLRKHRKLSLWILTRYRRCIIIIICFLFIVKLIYYFSWFFVVLILILILIQLVKRHLFIFNFFFKKIYSIWWIPCSIVHRAPSIHLSGQPILVLQFGTITHPWLLEPEVFIC